MSDFSKKQRNDRKLKTVKFLYVKYILKTMVPEQILIHIRLWGGVGVGGGIGGAGGGVGIQAEIPS